MLSALVAGCANHVSPYYSSPPMTQEERDARLETQRVTFQEERRAEEEKRNANEKALKDAQLQESNNKRDEIRRQYDEKIARSQKEYERQKELNEERSKKPSPKIGMKSYLIGSKTNWGSPIKVIKTTTSSGVREQWVYEDERYLFFTNNILDAIVE